jgi:hypothetical protein
MDEKKIRSLIDRIEGQKLDYKAKEYFSSSTKEIAKDISSFINATGGLILIGVKDNKPDGLALKQADEERIMCICRDRLDPPQTINFEKCSFEENAIVVLDIIPSREPVMANGQYFIRHGSTTRLMTQDEIKKKYIESQKIYKIIKKRDAERIIKQSQSVGDVILDKEIKKSNYLTLESLTGPIIGNTCFVYGKLYETFSNKSKIIYSTLHNVTIEELVKILAQYYKIFNDYSYSKASFGIEQHGLNWVGFGPRDFIETLKDQKERYDSIYKKYGEDVHIHHRESALFIDEIPNGLFFISCEPNSMVYSDKLTIDYFDIGFIFKNQPFSRLFNDFFNYISSEPLTFTSTDQSPLNAISVETISIPIKARIPFKSDGMIQSIRSKPDKNVWISGIYGKRPRPLLELGLNDDIIVHLKKHHWLEDNVSYNIFRIKYTQFTLGCFPAAIVSIDADW